jgi:hypothetical protein
MEVFRSKFSVKRSASTASGSSSSLSASVEDDAASASLARILCYVPRCVHQFYLKKKKIQLKPSCKQTEASLLFADVSGTILQ